jgi:glucose-6-phosphate isomerase
MQESKPLTKSLAWSALRAHYEKIKDIHLRQLFATDSERGTRFTAEGADVYLDFSKNRITDETIRLLVQLARERGVGERRDAMFRGEKINVTEKRAVLHVALRAPKGASIVVDGENVVPQINAVLDRMTDFSNRIRSGEWKGHAGKRIRNIINIGIGGSDLGPVMAYEALRYYSDRSLTFRFVSNVDGTDFVEATRDLDPAETLFIISSKTFTTLETMSNARAARQWSISGLGNDERSVAGHCRGFHQCCGGSQIRYRYQQHVRVLGLGWRPLFDGFRDRPLDYAGHWPRQLPRHARRLPSDGRALPHRTT